MVRLGSRWLVGEAVAVAMVLLPAIAIARWTVEGRHLRARAALQVATAGMLFLLLVPEMAFSAAVGAGVGTRCFKRAGLVASTGAAGDLSCWRCRGCTAVMEFAERGLARRLHLIRRNGWSREACIDTARTRCSCRATMVMLAWAGVLRNGGLVLAAVIAAVYSAGIAAWG